METRKARAQSMNSEASITFRLSNAHKAKLEEIAAVNRVELATVVKWALELLQKDVDQNGKAIVRIYREES